MATTYKYYVVIRADGRPKVKHGQSVLYKKQGWAERYASADGDSVIEVELSLERPPVFIRNKKL